MNDWMKKHPYSKVLSDVHLTGSQITQSALLLHHTLSIVIGDTEWYAPPTSLWAGTPWRCLGNAIFIHNIVSGEGPWKFEKDTIDEEHEVRFTQTAKPITMQTMQALLTLLRGMSRVGLAQFTRFITEPFLTTLTWNLHTLGWLTPHPGWLGLSTERHTPDSPIHTETAILTTGLKTLATAVNHTIILTACSPNIWNTEHVKYHDGYSVHKPSFILKKNVCIIKR